MIRHNNIALRAVEEGDASSYLKWINDPETNFYRGLYPPTSEAVANAWIKEQLNQTTEKLTFAIEEMRGDAVVGLIGFIGLRGICARSRRAEMWIYLGAKNRWGEGFGKDSLFTICQYAFSEMNLHRLWLECDPEHVASVQCYEKNGFVKEGTQREAYYRRGKFRDTIIMGLLRPDWENASSLK